jgi:hypothetical protein
MSELTLKSAKSLYCKLGETIKFIEHETDIFITARKQFNVYTPNDSTWTNYYSANAQLRLIYLDFCAAYRLYLIGTTNYEQRFALKNVCVIIKEGYKRIYGFTEHARNKSIWFKSLQPLSEQYPNILKDEARIVSEYLENFKDELITDDKSKNFRDLAVHYSEDCIDAYNFLSEIDAEQITKSAENFINLMNVIGKYCSKVNQINNPILNFTQQK